jgi:hypothetical protein
VIEAKIRNDAVDPSVEGALKAKIRNALVRFQEGFLIHILSFVLRAREVHGKAKNRLVVVPYQLLEGSAIATLRVADQ